MSSYKYDPKSLKAEEFINHEEILESLDYAKKNKESYVSFYGICTSVFRVWYTWNR